MKIVVNSVISRTSAIIPIDQRAISFFIDGLPDLQLH